MIVDIELVHPNAVIPTYSHSSDGALDITAVSVEQKENLLIYDSGIAVSIPDGYVGLLFPRSSIIKQNQRLSNSVGVIDSSFRGTIKIVFDCINNSDIINYYKSGDRIGQLMIIPRPSITFRKVEKLNCTSRGTGGFGSTGQ